MIVYIVLVIMLIGFDYLCEDKSTLRYGRKFVFSALLIFMCVISAFRYRTVGFDTSSYFDRFYQINAFGPKDNSLYDEIGFRYFCYVLAQLGFGPQSVLIVSSMLLAFMLYLFFTGTLNDRYYVSALFIFVCSGYYFSSMNILRQYMSISFGIIAFLLYYRKKYLISTISFILAVLFHTSAVLLLLVPIVSYFLKKPRSKFYIMLMFFVVGIFSFIGVSNIASIVLLRIPRWDQYANSHWVTDRNMAAAVKIILPNLVVIVDLFQRHETSEIDIVDDREERYSYIDAGALLYVLILDCVFGFTTLTRLTEFFSPFFVVYLMRFVCRQNSKYRWLIRLAVTVYYLLIFYGSVVIQDSNAVVPYRSIFG